MTATPTPAQQEAYDACLVLARVLQADLDPSPRQFQRVRDALAALKREPQPAGLLEGLEVALGAFFPGLLADDP